jgi:hypothetical protein
MNDNELITAVRESVADVHTTTPVERILSRGRVVRARRRIPVVTGALAVAAGTALALTALLPASHPASRQPRVQLAAWKVTRQPGGNVLVTIRELHDPAGLQAALRADGVPATVTFLSQLNPACQPWPGAALHGPHTPAGDTLFSNVFPPPPPGAVGVIVIRPSALPSGGGVQLAAGFGPGTNIRIGAGLVQTSPQCTGS